MLLLALFALPALAQSYVGEVVIEKEVKGERAPEEAVTWDFEFSCTFDGDPITLGPDGPDVVEFTLGDGNTESISDVPDGGECTVEEIGPTDSDADFDAPFVSIRINDGDPVVGTSTTFPVDGDDDTTITVTFTNDFGDIPTAELDLIKVVEGAAAPHARDFKFEIACSEQDTVTTVLGVDGTLEGFPVILDDEDGAECVVTEIEDGGASSTALAWDGVSTTDGSVTVEFDPPSDDADEVQSILVTATNIFDKDVPVEVPDEPAVLAITGFELTWAMLLAVALLAAGALGLYAARRRNTGESR